MEFHGKTGTLDRVLDRLTKAKKLAARDQGTDNGKRLHSKFEEIEQVLQNMDGNFLPEVKRIEKDVMKGFISVEGEIDDDIFEDHQNFNGISEKLEHVLVKTESLSAMISSVTYQRNDAAGSSSVTQAKKSLQGQPRMASERWSEWITADTLLNSKDMNSLLYGFDDLPTRLQLCLLYLSIFPANCEIKKRPLTYWLISEDLVAMEPKHSADEVADDIFQKLIDRRFIRANKSPGMDCFSLHPLIRRCLISLAKKAKLFSFDNETEMLVNDKRAFFLSDNQDLHLVHNVHDVHNIRNVHDDKGVTAETLTSVFNINRKNLNFGADDLSKLKKVVVLQLGRWQSSPKHHIELKSDESLKGLKSLQHLRYLSLRGISRIFILPNSLTELVSLEILDLRACHNLEKLPSDISSLKNLTHLDMSECYLLESMPNGLEMLSKLQILKGFRVGSTTTISELADLKELRKLGLYVGSKADLDGNYLEALKEIVSLRNLTISWGTAVLSQNVQSNNKPFKLPSSLRKLDLRCILVDTLPKCVDLSNLKELEKLYIRGGKLENLECVELNWSKSIKILRLKYLKGLKFSEVEFEEKFPNVVYFEAIPCIGCKDTGKDLPVSEVNVKANFPGPVYRAIPCTGCKDIGIIRNKGGEKELTLSF